MTDVGYKNFIDEKRIKGILKPDNTRAKWFRKEAFVGRYLIDCTQGRKTNCIIILKSGHVILSTVKYSSMCKRLEINGVVLRKKKPINMKTE